MKPLAKILGPQLNIGQLCCENLDLFTAISRIRPWLLLGWDVGVGVEGEEVLIGSPASDCASEGEIRGYGVTVRIPLPKWAVAAISVLLVFALALFGRSTIVPLRFTLY
jgi:hypothetical protein